MAGCSILVCEDEPLIALDIAEAFTNAGARVMTVGSPADALTALEDEVPSAVILDHALSDGESSQLRECFKERNIPYVIHSGYGAKAEDASAAEAACVSKPASPQLLVTTVEGLLRSRHVAKVAEMAHPQAGAVAMAPDYLAGVGQGNAAMQVNPPRIGRK